VGKLLVLLAILAVALGFGDVIARRYAERQLARRISDKVTASAVHVTIASFPFLGRLAAAGTVSRIRAQAKGVSSGDYTFDTIVVTARDVRIDRGALVRHRLVRLKGISSGTVIADMTEAEVDKAIASRFPGADITLGNGTAQATVAGVRLTGQVTVVNGQLRVSADGLTATIPVPQLPLLPCVASATLTPGHLLLSCTIHQVPAALLNRAA
jgi:hypothetical protein